MSFTRIASILLFALVAVSVPALAFAQAAPYSQVVVTTQLSPGMPTPVSLPTVSITASNPSLGGIPNNSSSILNYVSNFNNDIRTVTFVPGSYTVTASGSNYYFLYSQDCSGFTPLNGTARYCTITLTTTPPATANCNGVWYGSNYGCTLPVVPYIGSNYQTQLTCNPSYQTVAAGQSATFTASGAGFGGYNWSTANRTFLNIGPTLTTILQTVGTQTVIVSNGVQSATCTVNSIGTGGAISYNGSPSIASNYVAAYVPTIPNTGFAPQNGAAYAFVVVLLIGCSIFLYPYVRKTVAAVI